MLIDPTLGYYDEGLNLTESALYQQARAPFGAALTLPPACYRSKVFSSLEDNRVWARSWIAVGSDQEIANPGDLLPFTIGYHGIHLQRGRDGVIQGRFNKAQHGGCRSVPLQCQTGSRTRCSFTSCGYSRDRDVVPAAELAAEGSVENQYLGLIPERLLPVRVGQWNRLLFASLDPRTPDLVEGIEIPDAALQQGAFSLVGKDWIACKANWKLIGPALHAQLSSFTSPDGAERAGTTAIRDRWPLEGLVEALPARIGRAGGQVTLMWCFPNLLLLLSQRQTLAILLQPLSMIETQLRILLFNGRESSGAPKLDAWSSFLQPALEKAEEEQDLLSAWGTPGCRETSGASAPLQRNIFAWMFQDHLTARILEEDEHYGEVQHGRPDRGFDRGLSPGGL